ncbi:GGDEF domain-containing protein [Rhodoferax sp.]|uniref:GGDEF domain-containing protein n=1 Tax=Rhodoferax sp. TaxID=50421 RepID=UPI0025FC3D26|nr:GGDEF domain-containing protein [Rhodoferax sp.]
MNKPQKYTQSKEKSAELLRIVLARMGQHDAAFNPLTFTVWFEYAAGINHQLNQAIDALLQTQPRLGDMDLWNLYHSHVAEVDPQAMHRIGDELQLVMKTLGTAASDTGGQAGKFGAQLESLAAELQGVSDKLVSPAMTQAIEGTTLMRRSAQALESEVRNNQIEIQRLQSELNRVRDESLVDALTQVLNRKGFETKLAAMMGQPTGTDRAHWLVMFDLDHFKKVNDTHGHVMGDRVLQALGEVLKSCLSVCPHASVARYGGEEFALMLPDSSKDECSKMAELVRTRTKALKIRDRRTQEVVLTVTISGGMSAMKADDDSHSLVARADAALYQSKQGGRDRITFA